MATEPLNDATDPIDVLVIGAGISGIYQLYKLAQTDLTYRAVEAGDGVGGTWYWNRYPGARFDSESYSYAYFFSEELLGEWNWTEHFAGQPEIENYLNTVVDRFDLRRHITFGVRVLTMTWDEAARTWSTTLSDGSTIRSRFVVTAIGILSAPQYPAVPGIEDFQGESYHTGLWPKHDIDFTGMRVAVIGTGSSGVQIISAIAGQVGSMTVYQRTPNWCTPLNNRPITAEEQQQLRADFDQMHTGLMGSFAGFVHNFSADNPAEQTPEQRAAYWETLWQAPGFAKLLGNYVEVMTDKDYNTEFTKFLEAKIRARVHDQKIADKLIPDHGYGVKRPPFETDYYEVFNLPHVSLIDMRDTPIERVTPRGIATADGEREFDIIVYATGFDAITGAFDRIEITGTAGTLKDYWAEGPHTVVGAASPGFPNLFFVVGPHSSAGNVPRISERQCDFVNEVIGEALRRGCTRVEARPEAEAEWTAHVYELNQGTLGAQAALDYTYGVNTPGKAVTFRHYDGGLIGLTAKHAEIADSGYAAFDFS
ncbi:steroid monooxygenase [Mycolicibacterium chitae]|uniref:Putative flavoprotein involved in K+ transport n=1 Tax=Mycolicibacterium chitae TaxID=1792 RepID=A0A3S4RG35_MYCCI|nr:NAD(P)/FAD-dependent oxidoreductase [Mycolicibacterium chitae]MCV7108530.1 NAD(P)/FAD-dependent oxidoreductase [Mycolicibacterium chitae]BBZ00762.1 steroid monooxygenase [Mycolicibacterium chitae]VEG49610.1 putative flavoprotein involved in K+ transport [Mycolicibacterium chitae]